MIAISYRNQGIGKLVANSKLKHSWTFKINNKTYKVDLLESKMSGNFQVILDEQATLYKGNHKGSKNTLLFDFDVNNINLQIKSVDGIYDLFYKTKSFHFYLKNPQSNRNSVSNKNDHHSIPIKEAFEEELRNGLIQYGQIPMNHNLNLIRRGTVDSKSIERNRGLSEFGGGIPVNKKIPFIDPNMIIANKREVYVHGRCQLESRGDFFLEIVFPDGTDNAGVIYQIVHGKH